MVWSKLNKSMSVQGRSGLGSCTKVGSLYGFIRNDHMEPPHVDKMTDRQTQLKTLPPRNFVGRL